MPASAVRTFTDPDAYHAAIRDAHAKSVITGRGKFRAESTTIRFDRLSLQRCEETLPRTTYSAVDPKVFGFVFATSPGQGGYINGLEASSDEIVAFRAGSEGHNRILAASQWGSIALAHKDAAAAGQTIS